MDRVCSYCLGVYGQTADAEPGKTHGVCPSCCLGITMYDIEDLARAGGLLGEEQARLHLLQCALSVTGIPVEACAGYLRLGHEFAYVATRLNCLRGEHDYQVALTVQGARVVCITGDIRHDVGTTATVCNNLDPFYKYAARCGKDAARRLMHGFAQYSTARSSNTSTDSNFGPWR